MSHGHVTLANFASAVNKQKHISPFTINMQIVRRVVMLKHLFDKAVWNSKILRQQETANRCGRAAGHTASSPLSNRC